MSFGDRRTPKLKTITRSLNYTKPSSRRDPFHWLKCKIFTSSFLLTYKRYSLTALQALLTIKPTSTYNACTLTPSLKITEISRRVSGRKLKSLTSLTQVSSMAWQFKTTRKRLTSTSQRSLKIRKLPRSKEVHCPWISQSLIRTVMIILRPRYFISFLKTEKLMLSTIRTKMTILESSRSANLPLTLRKQELVEDAL